MINEESLTEPFNPVINDRELSLSLSGWWSRWKKFQSRLCGKFVSKGKLAVYVAANNVERLLGIALLSVYTFRSLHRHRKSGNFISSRERMGPRTSSGNVYRSSFTTSSPVMWFRIPCV